MEERYKPLPVMTPFVFNDPATTEIYTLSLHDALPICSWGWLPPPEPPSALRAPARQAREPASAKATAWQVPDSGPRIADRERAHMVVSPPFQQSRSEEHTSELQSLAYLVCRLLLEKKK